MELHACIPLQYAPEYEAIGIFEETPAPRTTPATQDRTQSRTEIRQKAHNPIHEILHAFILDPKKMEKISPVDNFPEINSMRVTLSAQKHQLCFWHGVTALKKRLSILRRMPAFYNVNNARDEFPWIEKDFVPIVQCSTKVSVI